ncbi:MAG: PDDEXK nuclease domain-containing protein [Saccharofermentans sp.]|nr:PDDEXK nuclease domain-containing protein [Saccharofermentans sp.]
MSDIVKFDEQYAQWIKDVSSRFRQSQIKAACKVNVELMRFYWSLGRDISIREKENAYGTDFFKKLSADLCDAIPEVKSFSDTNLRYMKRFYELYPSAMNLPQAVGESSSEKNLPQVVAESEQMIFRIPWGHNRMIIDKCKNDHDKAMFFVRQTIENNWSRAVLLNFLDTDLYQRQGKAITNFSKVLPAVQSDLAQEMTKDPYNFDFLTLRSNYDEKELKDALMNNVQKLLMELGKGFAFVGREYRLVVGETEQFIDMLFYNITNHCYVVVEVKVRDFEPGDMGQLGTYIGAVDGILKTDGDNPTIGLLICKTKDNVLAQYAVNMINAPIGISEYELSSLLPEEFKSSMPTIEEIENELKDK